MMSGQEGCACVSHPLEIGLVIAEVFSKANPWMPSFVWQRAPLHRFETLVATSLAYACFAITAKVIVKPTAATNAKSYVLATHNALLCVASLLICLGTTAATLRRAQDEGFAWFLCESQAHEQPSYLAWWLYLYYISKYYELLDTVLAFMQRRPPKHYWMHVYHHFCVLYMAYFYVDARQTLAVGGVLFNTFVHIFMYYYYARAALKLRTSWKNWITRLQIVQFLTSFGLLSAALYAHPDMFSQASPCAGKVPLVLNGVFNVTLISLFFRVLDVSKRRAVPSRKAH